MPNPHWGGEQGGKRLPRDDTGTEFGDMSRN